MVSRSVSAPLMPAPRGTAATPAGDDDTVRAYLRLLSGAPVRQSDRLEAAELGFVDVARRWSLRSGVDRRTLASLGVPRTVLDEAGVWPTPVADLVRRHYSVDAFTVSDLVRRSAVSIASVRNVVAEDERVGQLERVGTEGRMVLYGLR